MVDRLRLWLNRPLRDGDRARLFAATAAVILAATVVFALLDDGEPAPTPPARAAGSPAPAAAPTPVEPVVLAAETVAAPSEEGDSRTGEVASRRDVAAAKRAARRFLTGYLPYAYGRGGARGITAADRELRERLARERPRVPVRKRRRRPRVLLLHADGAGRDRARMVAVVGDGKRRYTVGLELARTAAGWRVTDVGG